MTLEYINMRRHLPIILILILGFALRFHRYEHFPVFGETKDELAWTWMGSSIVQGKHPTAWSATGKEGYFESREIEINLEKYHIVTPYLDNPHLFSLIPGAAAVLAGYKDIELPSIKVIRFPMVILGTINILLLFYAARSIMTKKYALLTALLYATIPTFVFTSRFVMAENLLISFMLLSIFFLDKYHKTKDQKLITLLGIISGLSLLTKVSGLVILVTNTLVLLKTSSKKSTLKMAALGVAIGSLYPLYGLITSKELFLSIIHTQSDFSIGFSQFISLFMFPQLAEKTLVDGWRYLGLFSLMWILIKDTKSKSIAVIKTYILIWFGFLLTATNEVGSHGWYIYPLFPLMSIAMGKMISNKKSQPFLATLIYILAILPTLKLMESSMGLDLNTAKTRLIMALGFIPLIIHHFKQSVSIKKLTSLIILIAISLNIFAIINYNHIHYWEDSSYYYPFRSGDR